MYVCVAGGGDRYVHVCAFCLWRSEVWDPHTHPELELKMAVSHLRGVLGIELLVGEEHTFLIGVPSLQAPAKRLK